jgi:hypothetical protein
MPEHLDDLDRMFLRLAYDQARTGFDEGLHDLEDVQGAAESGIGVGDEGGEPKAAQFAFSVIDLIGALESAVDLAAEFRGRVGGI